MNLRDLQYVLAVAENLSFKRAADICNVSQPTLSMQIKKMEDLLGVQLFERTNKSVLITDAGHKIIEIAKRMIHDEQVIYEVARNVCDPSSGTFKLGAIPTLASYIFPRYVPVITKAFPKLNLLLVEEKTETLLDQLKACKIDGALLALPIDDASLESELLFNDPFLLAVGRNHRLAQKKRVSVSDLKGNNLLLLDEGHCLRDQALAVCHTHGANEDKSFRATSLETLRLMVQSSDSGLMTLMPSCAVMAHDQLHYIPFGGPTPPSRHIALVWRKTCVRTEILKEMAKTMAKAAI